MSLMPLTASERLSALLPQVSVVDAMWAAPRIAAIRAREQQRKPAERLIASVAQRITDSIALVSKRSATPLTISYPAQLPVSNERDRIIAALKNPGVLVLTGETGSGKTTQLPKLLWEAGFGRRGMIGMTQPRRVAAIAMAARIREEMQATEKTVAHSVRFDDRMAPETIVRVMTDGLLLAEVVQDHDFARYDALIIDEAHERSLNIDLLLGLVRLVRERRPDFKVVISSASIAAERFAQYYSAPNSAATYIAVAGRTFPVEIRHQPPDDDDIGYVQATLSTIRSLHDAGEKGDVLCFLPTERDILEARRRLQDIPGLIPLPLFSRLTPSEQQRVFAPHHLRKIILATNIAETSLTITGIRFVIDAGLARMKRYQASSRTERLPIEAISRASCLQRAGRAGRVEAGVCIRLYPAEDFSLRDEFTAPEILRSNLAGVLLSCLSLGLGDPEQFPWIDAPSPHAWSQARQLLEELGAFTASDKPLLLSPLGRQLASIPADPQIARMLLAGVENYAAAEVCTIAAFLSVQDPRVRPVGQEAKADAAHKPFQHEAGDIMTVLKWWHAYEQAASNAAKKRFCEQHFVGFRRMREWADVRHQLWNALREMRKMERGQAPHQQTQLATALKNPEQWPVEHIHKSILAGLLGNILLYDQHERAYRGAGNRIMHVHPGSALRAGKSDDGKRAPAPMPWLVACEVVETSRLFARMCAPILPAWVIALAGERVKRRHDEPHWHPGRKQVVVRETILWKGLALSEGKLIPFERIDPVAATRIFIEQVLVRDSEDMDDINRLFPIIATNKRTLAVARSLRERLRDPSLYIDDERLTQEYVQRLRGKLADVPLIASADALRRWIATHGADALRMRVTDLCEHSAAAEAERLAPTIISMGSARFQAEYRFIPGDDSDGMTLIIPEAQIAQVDAQRLAWLVPAWWSEVIAACIAQLPKEVRRLCIPLAETVAAIRSQLDNVPAHGSLVAIIFGLLQQRLTQQGTAQLKLLIGDEQALPAHLRVRFCVRGSDNAPIYVGRDASFIVGQAAAGDRLAALKLQYDTKPGAQWPGDCPLEVQQFGQTGFTAIVRDRDAQGAVAARRTVFASKEAAQAWHADGLAALIEAHHDERLARFSASGLSASTQARCEKLLDMRLSLLRRHYALALITASSIQARTESAWHDYIAHADKTFAQHAGHADVWIQQVAEQSDKIKNRLRQGAKNLAMSTVMRCVGQHYALLLSAGWSTRLPWSALQRLPDYLYGMQRLLDQTQAKPSETVRISERIQQLITLWDNSLPQDVRGIQALGLWPTVRELIAVREETILGFITGSGHGAGFSEARLREGLANLTRQSTMAEQQWQRLRNKAIDLRASLQRLPPDDRRTQLMKDGERLIAQFIDLSFLADPGAQCATLEAWVQRAQISQNRGRA
jgi:ATP-dependent helicase HrpA